MDSPKPHLWRNTILFAGLIYALSSVYGVLYVQTISIAVCSEALAFTAGILIGSSFVLSSLTYFFNFMDTKLKYRKQLGLLGYYVALAYSITLFLRNVDHYGTHASTSLGTREALLGLSAMAILSMMAIISGNWAIKLLGNRWRMLLRTGYIAYILLIIRAFIIEGGSWRQWAFSFMSLPPPRLILSIFALIVIYARIGLEIALRLKKKLPTQPK
ncbi:MAG: hypothetical protein ABI758_01250 [Candidatus Woesebacteria bacterium]